MLETLSEGYKPDPFPIPAGIDQKDVDAISGYPSHDGFPSRSESVISGTLPTSPDPIHVNLKVCKGQSGLASESDIASGNFDTKEFIILKEIDPVSKDGQNRWQTGIDTWLGTQTDSRYHPPTQGCGTTNNVFVSWNSPHDQDNISGTSVPIDVSVATDGDVDHVDIYVDDVVKSTLTSRPYTTTLVLTPGAHKLNARATRKDGQVGISSDLHIGVGGVAWNATPTPAATPTPTP
jgi:hypothetical protein